MAMIKYVLYYMSHSRWYSLTNQEFETEGLAGEYALNNYSLWDVIGVFEYPGPNEKRQDPKAIIFFGKVWRS